MKMADQRIEHRDGSATVLDDHYGFGSFSVGVPDRPEPPRPERKKLNYKALLKKMDWTDAQYNEAQQYNFPIGGKTFPAGVWRWNLVWYEDLIDRWVADRRANIAAQQALLRSLR